MKQQEGLTASVDPQLQCATLTLPIACTGKVQSAKGTADAYHQRMRTDAKEHVDPAKDERGPPGGPVYVGKGHRLADGMVLSTLAAADMMARHSADIREAAA